MPSSFNYSPTPTAGSVTATASGKLSDGSKVILNSNGTVSLVAATTTSSVTTSIASTQAGSVTRLSYIGAASYDPVKSVVVVYWIGYTSNYPNCTAGVVSGTTITFGNTTVLMATYGVANGYNEYGFGACYVPSVDRHVVAIARNDGSMNIVGISASSSGNTAVTAASTIVVNSYCNSARVVYDPINDKVVVSTYDQTATDIAVTVVTVATNTFTIGTVLHLMTNGGSGVPCTALAYDSLNQKIILLSSRTASDYMRVAVGTISGSTISFGAQTVVESSVTYLNNQAFDLAFSVSTGKVFVIYGLLTPTPMRGAVGTVSGTTISFGTPADLTANKNEFPHNLAYYTTTGIPVMMSGQRWTNITITGNSFTEQSGTFTGYYSYQSIVAAPTLDLILTVGDSGGYPAAKGAYSYNTTLTSTNFLGISSASYGTGSAATIQTVGSVDDAQSGLTAGLKYYISDAGNLSTLLTTKPYVGLALSSTRLLIKG